MKYENKLSFYIGLLPFIMVLGNSMLIPILPEIERELMLTTVQTGMILSMFSIPAAIVIPFIGFLSDWFGRKEIILICLSLIIVGSIFSGLSALLFNGQTAYYSLLTGRVIQGIGAGGTTPLAMALVGDLFIGKNRSKVLGILEVFNGIGKVIAPILGAFAAIWSWYLAFFIFPITAVISYTGIRNYVGDSKSGENVSGIRHYVMSLATVFKNKWMKLFPLYLIGGVGLFILFGILYYLSFYIEETYRIDGFFKGFVFLFPLSSLTFTSFWTGKYLEDSLNKMNKLFFLGIGLMTVCFLLLIFLHSFSLLLFLLTVAFSGLGFILPCINMMITSLVDDGERGFVVSLYGTARFLGVALGPIVFGIWMDDIPKMYLYSFLILVASCVVFILTVKEVRIILLEFLHLK
ncbi:MFS transporter [Bacillus aquiflavi]|uniref:MFS transporter n=1 Tax=Bacillus aquiflavi TaxID=2672567 RepID=A0A6B3VXX9_9BACI|nr:MFS transporter [Bacillus aquiflavi]MBA4535839.1 MFS transporter [Bacillus aquiflavi]NEY80214.1 MFS transporter [Bacillus aquiflavi]